MISEFAQQPPRVFWCIGLVHSVMEMNLGFSPAAMAMLRQHLEQPPVVLLGGVKIGMDERAAVGVSPAINGLGIFADPPLQTLFLLASRNVLSCL